MAEAHAAALEFKANLMEFVSPANKVAVLTKLASMVFKKAM